VTNVNYSKLLGNGVQNNKKKSIIDATVSKFRSQFLVVSGVREGKGKI
jgi:hypothetical protein